jgi:Xaa-Pro aminopeptidase/Xaa-Pro dipeptidase
MDLTERYRCRLEGVRAYLREHDLDGALFTSYENRRYYCGFTGSNGYLIVTADEARLITDPRYTTQARQQTAPGCQVIEYLYDRLGTVANMIRSMGITALVIESCLTLDEYLPLKDKLDGIRFAYEQEYFLEQRMIKDQEEIANIRAAIAAAEAGFDKLLPKLRIGMTEKDVADELHYLVSKEGAEAMSFGTIVGSGARGALAHAFPTEKVIEAGDMVVIDFGVMKDGYCSDMTRTVFFGDVSPEHKRIFDLVLESQNCALAAIGPGVSSKTVEDAHRVPFFREGLDDYALRGLGHGIGLEIHECPRVQIGRETILRPGMIFTVEPGLYFPDDCGVRIEDDVLVTEDGMENLSHTPHMIQIG